MSETMKAVAIMADHKAEVVEAVKPQAEPGKVLLKDDDAHCVHLNRGCLPEYRICRSRL